jgi:hypothetical protein
MLEQELVQRFGPGHLVLICEEIEGIDCYRFGRVIQTVQRPLRLLTDKEREKLSKKSSYYGDGNKLTYTDK